MVEWIVVVYDRQGSDRMTCRAEHLEGIPKAVAAGKLVEAGPIFKDVVDGAPANFAGSHLTVVADSKEEVIEFLKQDVFYKNNIWDLDNALILPYRCGARVGKE